MTTAPPSDSGHPSIMSGERVQKPDDYSTVAGTSWISEILFTTRPARGILALVPTAGRIRRPKSDGRCIHCREPLVKPTKDHVFPSSWYPDTTPSGLERWTVPSCARCNGESGRLEKDLLVFFACCIDPTKPATRGLYQRVRRTIGQISAH